MTLFQDISHWLLNETQLRTITIIQIILDFPKEHCKNSHAIGSSRIKTK